MDSGLGLLLLMAVFFISAVILLYAYYKVCQHCDKEYYRNDD